MKKYCAYLWSPHPQSNNTNSVNILPDDDCDPAIELSKTRSCPSGMYPFEILTVAVPEI